jgi:C4-dicarboxylate transporter, DctM subunit
MEPVLAALVTIVVMFVLLASGAWVFVALILTCLVSLYFLAGFPIHRIGAIAEPALVKSVTSWELAAVPLFLWMGEMLNRSGLSFRLYRGLTPWLRGLPGGLLHTNIGGCVLFAAVSGSSVATTATIGQVTTRALRERNYDVGLSVGSIAAAGSIGIMIPPSLTMIIYGLIAEVSIARLFAAGMIPGLMLGALYRGIYSGTATPSEAAALGVAGTILVSLPSREFGLGAFLHSALAAARTTAMLGTIFAAAKMLSTTMGLLHLPHTVAAWIDGLGLSPYGLIFVLGVFYVLLGCVLESIAMILMTMPIAFPLVVRAGFDPVWFGVFIVLVVEMGLITPPIGFNLFVIRGITGYPIATIARGALPFFGLMLVGAFLITAFPGIALWLPRVLFG